MSYSGYKSLDVWNKGIDIVDSIYNITKNFPSDELDGLRSQMQSAVVSVPSNIAEGFRRNRPKDFIRFLRISLGSCAELETQLIIAFRRSYVQQKEFETISNNLEHEVGMLMNLIKKLKKQD